MLLNKVCLITKHVNEKSASSRTRGKKRLQLYKEQVPVYASFVFKVFRSGFSSAHQVTPEFVSRLDLERTLKGHEVYRIAIKFFCRAFVTCNPN